MNKKLINFIPYVIALALIFYVLPTMIISDTGSAMFIMLLITPVLTFICSAIYGIRQGFNFVLPVITAILFTPTIITIYNPTAWIYIVIYTIISIVGTLIGSRFNKKNRDVSK